MTLSTGTIAWAVATGVFAALRIVPAAKMPVAGGELVGLSGAWQRSIGLADDRYVATLFQYLCSLSLRVNDSETGPRLLALAGAASIPVALYLLRPALGDLGAVVALVLIAIDPVGIVLTSTATAAGFDLAVALWLVVVLVRCDGSGWPLAVAGFAVVTGGPVALSLGLVVTVAWAGRATRSDVPAAGWAAGGILAGVAAASLAFDLRPLDLVLPPFATLESTFRHDWSSTNGWGVGVLYVWPLIVGGFAAVPTMFRAGWPRERRLITGWLCVSAGWWLLSSSAPSPVAAAGVTIPAALLLGPALPIWLAEVLESSWARARVAIPAAVLLLGVAAAFVVDWARLDRVGDAQDQAVVVVVLVGVVGLAAWAWREPGGRTPLGTVPLGVGALFLVAGGLAVGLARPSEPLTLPSMPEGARDLRNAAVASAGGAPIGVDRVLAPRLTWALRNSGPLQLDPGPEDSGVVILGESKAPPGAIPWVVEVAASSPSGSPLRALAWLTDRNGLRHPQLRVFLIAPYTNRERP